MTPAAGVCTDNRDRLTQKLKLVKYNLSCLEVLSQTILESLHFGIEVKLIGKPRWGLESIEWNVF